MWLPKITLYSFPSSVPEFPSQLQGSVRKTKHLSAGRRVRCYRVTADDNRCFRPCTGLPIKLFFKEEDHKHSTRKITAWHWWACKLFSVALNLARIKFYTKCKIFYLYSFGLFKKCSSFRLVIRTYVLNNSHVDHRSETANIIAWQWLQNMLT